MLPVWFSPAYEKGGFDLNNHSYLAWTFKQKKKKKKKITVVPTKSDSDEMFCLQLLSKTLTCTLHLS